MAGDAWPRAPKLAGHPGGKGGSVTATIAARVRALLIRRRIMDEDGDVSDSLDPDALPAMAGAYASTIQGGNT